MDELLLSRGLTGESFNLIPPIDPKSPYFAYKSWSVNSDCPKKGPFVHK